MHPVYLISQATINHPDRRPVPDNVEIVRNGTCCVTGEICDCVPRSLVLSSSFTNIDLLAAPGSDLIGVDAYHALTFKWERCSCWVCDGKRFIRPTRIEVRDMILYGVDFALWTGYITTSYKKHGALWSKINTGRHGIWRFEMIDVDCRDAAKVQDWYGIMNAALHAGIGRPVIENLRCSAWLMNKVGMNTWLIFEQWARPRYLSGLYQLLCYLLPSQEEMKGEKCSINYNLN